jgi:hypothetical protein
MMRNHFGVLLTWIGRRSAGLGRQLSMLAFDVELLVGCVELMTPLPLGAVSVDDVL